MRVALLVLSLVAAAAAQPAGRRPPGGALPVRPGAPPLIVFFGDSLTEGFGLDSGQSFPALIERDLEREGYRYRVENLGVSGDTTQDGLARVDMAVNEHPALVVLELGANDGLRGEPVANIEKNLAELVERFKKGGSTLLLTGITLPPNYGATYVSRFTAIYPELAKRYQLKLMPFLLQGVAGNPSLMQRDGLHPNAEGEKLVARTVWQSLRPLLRK
jgi:acyl-CoA thioesterase-1